MERILELRNGLSALVQPEGLRFYEVGGNETAEVTGPLSSNGMLDVFGVVL